MPDTKMIDVMIFLLRFRLPDWAELAIIPGGELEFISNYCFQLPTMTNGLARLKAGFFIREILYRLTSKKKSVSSELSIWMYFGHDTTIANVLNALGLFEVFFTFSFKYSGEHFFFFLF